MASLASSFLKTLEKYWRSSFAPAEALLESLAEVQFSIKPKDKHHRVLLALTEVMLLRQINRQAEADVIEQKNEAAFNRITNRLYKHRWKRMQLIEAFRTGKRKAEMKEVLQLIEEATEQDWIEEQLRALFLKHIVEKFSGQFSAALATAQQVKLLATQHQHDYYQLQSAWSVPHIYHFFGEKKRAYEECLKVEKQFTQDFSQPINRNFYVLLADCYAAFTEYDKAMRIYEALLTYFHQATLPDYAVYLSVLINTAHVWQQQKNLKKAETNLLEAKTVAAKINQPMYALAALTGLIDVYHKTKRYQLMASAIVEAEKFSALVKATSYEVKLLEYRALYEQAKGNFKKAFTVYQTYHHRFAQWKQLDNEEKLKAVENKHQLEMQTLKQQLMKKEMEHLQQELQLLNANVEQKNKLIKQFAGYFNELEQTAIRRKEIFVKLREMVHTVELSYNTETANYSAKFNEAHHTAIERLSKKYPAVSNAEAATAVMLTQGLSNKDIASLTLTTVRNIEKHRLQLRKKLKLKRANDLVKAIRKAIGN